MTNETCTPLILVHGGVGAPETFRDGCAIAADAGSRILEDGGSAVDAVVEATRRLEDDDRFNAGHGSRLRLDGRTIQMDAAVMDSDGAFGAVAAISNVPNPILVARRLLDAPPMLLAGEGAWRFAERHGLAGRVRVSDAARRKYRQIAALAAEGRLGDEYAAWEDFDVSANWNFASPLPDFGAVAARRPAHETGDERDHGAVTRDATMNGADEREPTTAGARDDDATTEDTRECDTVGAVARDAMGRFAATSSTGGTALMLLGRVGDSPLIGCGLYAGPSGAVTATGEGEEIMKRLLSKWVYDRIEEGEDAQAACEAAVALFPKGVVAGVIAVTPSGHGSAANNPMPWAVG